MKRIYLYRYTKNFAENKDIARDLRIRKILPIINSGEDIEINFSKVKTTTQSFIHALISDVIKKRGVDIINHIYFKKCSDQVKGIISIVVDYLQDNIS